VPFAALQFRSELETAFDKFSDDFLNRIAEQIAGAIALDQINEKLEAELTEQTALARIGQLIGSSTDIGTVFNDIAIALKQVIEFDTVLVNSIDNNSGTRVVLHQAGRVTERSLVGDRRPLKDSLTEKVRLSRGVLRSVSNDEFTNEYSVVLPNMKDGFKSQIAIPLISQNEVVGTLQLRSTKDDTYPQSQFRFLTLVGEQISGGMARTELSESQVVLAIERERAEGLESQNLELVQNRRIREQFLGMVTHELRTPLTSISAFTDILGHNKEGTLTERQLQQLSAVSRNSTQLSELIDDLIHMSRMERGEFELNVEQTDLVEILKQVCESMAPVMQHRDQKLVSEIDFSRLRLNLDHSRMTQVLNNLISNSSKFSPQGSTVTVKMTSSDDNAQIDVIDEGPGINSEEFETVFDPFYRIDNEAAKLVPGTGLGLYVARTIVRQHGGEVSIASGTNGTTFRIVIPIENPNI
jgi:signal transduction histidine kinase